MKDLLQYVHREGERGERGEGRKEGGRERRWERREEGGREMEGERKRDDYRLLHSKAISLQMDKTYH